MSKKKKAPKKQTRWAIRPVLYDKLNEEGILPKGYEPIGVETIIGRFRTARTFIWCRVKVKA